MKQNKPKEYWIGPYENAVHPVGDPFYGGKTGREELPYTHVVESGFYEKLIGDLKNLVNIQCSSGNWNYDPYMQGMANGMILALSILEQKEPIFLNVPNKWLCDIKLSPTTLTDEELTDIITNDEDLKNE